MADARPACPRDLQLHALGGGSGVQEGGSRGTECKPVHPGARAKRAWDPGDTEKPPRWPRAVSRRLHSHTAAAGSGRTLGQRRLAVSPHGQEGPGKWGRGSAKPQPGLLGEGPRQALRVMAPGGSARFSLLWGSLEDHTGLSVSWTTAAEKPSRLGPGAARRAWRRRLRFSRRLLRAVGRVSRKVGRRGAEHAGLRRHLAHFTPFKSV